ncbi:MAG: TenA family protein [Actinomycetota bacterium]|nr:TenA family protein [Actinomycetota bacterium]
MSLSDWLRAGAAPAWEQALGQRFVRDVVAGRLPDEVFRRYLRIEFRFVDTAACVLGRTVHVAPSFAARRRLAAGLHHLTTEQFDYFQQVAGRLGLELPAVDAPVPEGARALHEHFLAVAADGSYPALLGCMLGAEWLYATWCDEASRQEIGHSQLRAWVQLHTSPAFVGHVAWLRAELDLVGPQLTEPDRRRVLAAFQQTLWAEVSFHDVAYG